VASLARLRVDRIEHVVPIDEQPADAAELLVLREERAFLIEDLDAVIRAVRDEEAAA